MLRSCYTDQSHVRGSTLELSVHDEVDAVGLKQVLQVGNVFRIFVTVLGQTGNAKPAKFFQDLQVGIP